jgi:omega-6 fatty acid desaturase (delta-12 desaturase)
MTARTGSELVRATKAFSQEQPGRSRVHLATTVGALVAAQALLWTAPWWPLQLLAGAVAGLVSIRLFVLYHDYEHGTIFRNSSFGKVIFTGIGLYNLAAPSVWRETHTYHHRHNAKLVGSAIGSFPLVTVGMWKGMNEKARRSYRFVRHPATIFGGYFTVFWLGMCLSAFRRDRVQHRLALVSLVIHFVGLGLLTALAGPWMAFCALMLPVMISTGLGSYLFYAQHNFPDAHIRGRREWEFTAAALQASSMFDMSPVMHWFTGNIGYHHVHHLNHNIPFYRLPEVMAALPELQSPGRTSWRWRDVRACLRVALWDPDQARMVGFDEASGAGGSADRAQPADLARA